MITMMCLILPMPSPGAVAAAEAAGGADVASVPVPGWLGVGLQATTSSGAASAAGTNRVRRMR